MAGTVQSSFGKIGIFRALQLGDLLCLIPAVRALRHAYPLAEITIIGLPWQKFLTQRYPAYFDKFIEFAGYPGLPEQVFDESDYRRMVADIRLVSFDLLIQMQGNGSIVNDMLTDWGAKELAGFYPPGSPAPGDYFLSYPDKLSEPERHLALLTHIGVPAAGLQLEFPVYSNDRKKIRCLPGFADRRPYVCIHPGSRAGWRQWPPHCFAAIADAAAAEGYRIYITGTPGEAGITAAVIDSMTAPAIDLTGMTDLGTLAALIGSASLLVANCTGVSHIASATETPSIIISMDGEPGRWSPLNKKLHKVIDLTRIPSNEVSLQLALRFLNLFNPLNALRDIKLN